MRSEAERLWKALRGEVGSVSTRVNRLAVQTQRAETAGGVPAAALADAPLAADGGMSDGTNYIDLLWISDGLKSGETTGNGTGVLAVYDSSGDRWLRVGDYTEVQS